MKKVPYTAYTYFYKRIHNEDWYVDIVQKSDSYEIWLYKEPCSHKMFIIGLPTNSGVSIAGIEVTAEDTLEDGSYIIQYNKEIEALEALLTGLDGCFYSTETDELFEDALDEEALGYYADEDDNLFYYVIPEIKFYLPEQVEVLYE
jgi:hypothetical protein